MQTMFIYDIFFPKYKIREHEKHLAIKELYCLFPYCNSATVTPNGIQIQVHEKIDENKLKGLVFFSSFRCKNADFVSHDILTDQAILENYSVRKTMDNTEGRDSRTVEARSRKEIRYLSHSLHEYKGRFYPQLAGALLNYTRICAGQTVMDPFCGSGTALVESCLRGVNAVGVDLNPIAVLVSQAKVASIQISAPDIERIRKSFRHLKDDSLGWKKTRLNSGTLDNEYLKRWFPQENLMKALFILKRISKLSDSNSQTLCKAVLSDLLRQFSYQSPTDLRIRQRKDTPPSNVLDTFKRKLLVYLSNMRAFHDVKFAVRRATSCNISARWGDVKFLSEMGIGDACIDAIVTSPPYATALPYIDTDRLSLVLLGYANRQSVRHLERALIGSREIQRQILTNLEKNLMNNASDGLLPEDIVDLLYKIHTLNKNSDVGFRRKNLSALLYKYFTDMDIALAQMARVLKKDGTACIVVGGNQTTAGGEKIQIPTDDFIGLIAQRKGFALVEKIPMTVQKSYMIHSRNSINTESILILKR